MSWKKKTETPKCLTGIGQSASSEDKDPGGDLQIVQEPNEELGEDDGIFQFEDVFDLSEQDIV